MMLPHILINYLPKESLSDKIRCFCLIHTDVTHFTHFSVSCHLFMISLTQPEDNL